MAPPDVAGEEPRKGGRRGRGRSAAPPTGDLPVEALTPYASNPRKISDKAVVKVAESIKQFGFQQPIVADEAGEIIVGHTRWRAAQKLGMATVPVITVRGWSDEKKRAYRIADNRAGELSRWDFDLLEREWADLSTSPFDLLFEMNDLPWMRPGVGLDDDDLPEKAEQRASVGSLWALGPHRLLCGDSTDEADVSRLLGEVRPGLMVTDPPYGVSYDADWRNRADRANGRAGADRAIGTVTADDLVDWSAAWALFPGPVAYVWHAGRHASAIQESLSAAGVDVRSQIIWIKDNIAIGRGHYHWRHEPLWYAVREGASAKWTGGRKQSTVWEIPKPRKSETGHSTQKPVECMLRPMLNHDFPEVYDPFVGSGTTIIAAERAGKTAFCIEIEPKYVDICLTRWEAHTGEQAELIDAQPRA